MLECGYPRLIPVSGLTSPIDNLGGLHQITPRTLNGSHLLFPCNSGRAITNHGRGITYRFFRVLNEPWYIPSTRKSIVTTTQTPTQRVQQQQTTRSEVNKPPVIVLIDDLLDTQRVYSPNFNLRASVSDDIGLDVVQVMRNQERLYDSQTHSDAARQLQESSRRLLTFNVQLILSEGENDIAIIARDNNNEQTHHSISVTYERKENAIGLDAPYSDVDVDIPQGREKNPSAVCISNWDWKIPGDWCG